jgi:hypothetical protein
MPPHKSATIYLRQCLEVFINMEIKRFDLIRILTIEHVVWVSGPAGHPASPQGTWSVIGNIGNVLLISKDETVVQIPVQDVVKVADYNLERVFEMVRKVQSFEDLEKLLPKERTDGQQGQKEERKR